MKRLSKILSLILTVVMIIAAVPMTAAAKTYGDLTYTISNGEVTITDCDESVFGEIIIPDEIDGYPVTSIGSAFAYCDALTSITIPDSVTSIVDFAFECCESLTSVTIGNSVTSIGVNAFAFCPALTSVTIPDSVTSIGRNAFYECSALTSVTIGNSVTSIGKWAFSECSSLGSIIINNPDCKIYDEAVTINSSATIYGHEGSTAQVYAEKYSREFISIKCLQGQHVYESVVIEPTCISKGYTTYKCICGENYVTDYVDMIEHGWKIEKQIDATCVSEGKINYFCENCDATKSEIIPATGLHIYDYWIYNHDATCTEDGTKTGNCERCDASSITIIAEGTALGHNYNEWIILSEVSCSQDGIKIRICKNCSELEVHNTKAYGHIDDDADSRCDDCSCILEFPSVDDEDEQSGEELNAFAGIVEFFKKIFNFIKQLFGMK